MENWRVRSRIFDPGSAQHAPLNAYLHEPTPADHRYELFVTPNTDLLYSEVFIDLCIEPFVLHTCRTPATCATGPRRS